MTTRDPRSRDYPTGSMPSADGRREPTQSLHVDPDQEDSHPSLALGTADAAREGRTKMESPAARSKPPTNRPGSRPPPVPARGPDDPDLRLESVLGSYRIIELLGKGGMGYVYRAEHVKLGREVALKLLRSDYAKRRDAVARFFQEARTVNRVRHRNIVDVTDFVELDDGTTFIIMELLDGTALGKWARTGIDLPRALAVLVQICDGLGAAHQVGVVHRDLKPDNVIVIPTSDGADLVKLLDFGVAKLLNRDDEDVGFQTAAGSVIGTPAYMSPEQAGGMVIDARSDIYSLGAIMYELFCGQPMFRGRSFGEYVRKHLTEMPTPPRQTQAGAMIDHRLEALIMKCLEKDPNQRFASIVELRDALLHVLGSMETHPPAYAAYGATMSGVRPAPAQHATQLPVMPPTMHAPTPHSQPHPSIHYSGNRSSLAPPAIITQMPSAVPAPPTTPWWVWFIGGAVAVGLGVGAAVWYAGRSEGPERAAVVAPTPAPPVPAQPTTQPIETAPAPLEGAELRFDSLPAGAVFAAGHSAELCKTPCAFHVDLKDGGPTDRRKYVVKADGYKDGEVTVDFAAPQREFSVTLDRIEPPETLVDHATPSDQKTEPTTKHVTKKKKKKDRDKDKDKDKDAEVAKDPPTTTPPTATHESPDLDHLIDPTDGKPITVKKPPDKPKPTIDPADTLDPFHRKK